MNRDLSETQSILSDEKLKFFINPSQNICFRYTYQNTEESENEGKSLVCLFKRKTHSGLFIDTNNTKRNSKPKEKLFYF